MRIEKLAIGALRPYWRNPRQIDSAVEKVTESIRKYGYNQPIAVDEDYVIVAGHVRYRALQQLGYKTVMAVVLDLPADKIKAYRVVDNKTAEASEWDDDKLVEEIMKAEDPSFSRQWFSDQELWNILPTDTEMLPGDEVLPPGVGGRPTDQDLEGAPTDFGAERGVEDGASTTTTEQATIGNLPEGGVYVGVMCPECGQEQDVWIPTDKDSEY